MAHKDEVSVDEILASRNGLRAAVMERLCDLHIRHTKAGPLEKQELERQAVLIAAGEVH